jgi:site-specific DNA recombinase
MKYVAYYRKSTDTEDKQVLSLDGQQEVVKEYAEKNGLTITEEVKESFSAKQPGRPEFNRMIGQAKKGQIQGIIAYKLDRLTRNYADLGALAGLIERGVEIHDASYGIYKDDSNSFIMIGVNTAIASAKIKGLSEDVRRGLRQKREMGWFPGYAPTGYVNSKIEKTIEIDPHRAPFVNKAFKLYDSGQYSLKALAKKLYSDGFRSRTNSDHISKTSMERILKNPIYYGYFRSKGELFKGKHKGMVHFPHELR